MAVIEQIDILNELKLEVFQRVAEIDDLSAIQEIVHCIDKVAPKESYILSPEEKADIEQARKDYAEGRCIDHEEFMAELGKWRNEKRN